MRKGFTLVELLVVMAIISLLAAMLLPALARARVEARKTACRSNIKQVGNALQMYLNDSAGEWPSVQDDSSATLALLYDEYLDDLGVLACPATARAAPELDTSAGFEDILGTCWVDVNHDDIYDDPDEQQEPDYLIDTNLNGQQTRGSWWSSTSAIFCDVRGNHGNEGVNVLLAGSSAEWMRATESKMRCTDGMAGPEFEVYVVPNPHTEAANWSGPPLHPATRYGDSNIYSHVGDPAGPGVGGASYDPNDPTTYAELLQADELWPDLP